MPQLISQFISFLIILFGAVNLLRMTFLLIGSDIYTIRRHLLKKRTSRLCPPIGVIIPAHNEEKSVIAAIASVMQNDYPADKLQIVVVDDGSTDNTAKKVNSLVKKIKTHN